MHNRKERNIGTGRNSLNRFKIGNTCGTNSTLVAAIFSTPKTNAFVINSTLLEVLI